MLDFDKRDSSGPEGTGSSSQDGSYHYVRPESREVLYRDAGVESTEDAAHLPRYYSPPRPNQKKAAREDNGKQEPGHSGFFVRAACMCMACALLGGILGGGLTATVLYRQFGSAETAETSEPASNPDADPIPTPSPSGGNVSPVLNVQSGTAMTPADIYDMACSQVVGITTEVTFKNYFGQTSSSAVSGSGFIISEDGYILTNYHVIEYADQYGYAVQVMTHDGTAYTASIVGTEQDNDLAVLQIQAVGLDPVKIGNSDAIRVGDGVQTVGNPLGELDFTMTFGRVTAMDRKITTDDSVTPINMFQIDAAVNSGNSGGPVYNDAGEVIGIVTAKYSETGIEGLGFAIPINDAMGIAQELIANGYVSGKAYLGVHAKTMSSNAAQYYNSVEGAYVFSVVEGSPAQAAGLKAGDVIYRLGDLEVGTEVALCTALRSYHAGDTVELSVFRGGEELLLTVTLGEAAPPETSVLESANQAS